MNDPQAVDELLSDLPEVVTFEEIAELLRVSPATVLRWQREQGLKTLVLGSRIRRVRKTDLREFLLHGDDIEESDG